MTLENLIEAFDASFLPTFKTRLVGGFEEPLYMPSVDGRPAEIRFTRDYVRSALHEIAHWCIAGDKRRQVVDYGYWYRPDGRNVQEQGDFFKVEVKPQSLEMAFSKKCAVSFQVSCDNLDGVVVDESEFERLVKLQLREFEENGFPIRARQFMDLVLKN